MKNNQLKKLAERCSRLCCPDGRVNEQKVVKVIKNLKALPRSQALFAISEFLKALKKQKGKTTLVVESSIPLSKVELDDIVRKLKKEYLINEVENIVNEGLFGGFRVRIGDTVLDYSMKNKISQLKEALAS